MKPREEIVEICEDFFKNHKDGRPMPRELMLIAGIGQPRIVISKDLTLEALMIPMEDFVNKVYTKSLHKKSFNGEKCDVFVLRSNRSEYFYHPCGEYRGGIIGSDEDLI